MVIGVGMSIYEMKTITQIFLDNDGEYKTRVWYISKEEPGKSLKQCMKVVKTHPKSIRPQRSSIA